MKNKKIISIVLLIIWMTFIFVMSSFGGEESSSQSGVFVNIIVNIFKINNVSLVSFIVRKAAHITEYCILGFLFTNLMRLYNKQLYLGIIFSFVYAITDEIHQYFIPGRECQITDALIDLFGIILGYFIYKIIIQKRIVI